MQNFKNKRILITAGPTWVPIDNVRVISNIATGKTGILLAEKLQRLGAKVTLLLGPVGVCCLPPHLCISVGVLSKKINLIRFSFFDELKNLINKELQVRKYDWVIHSAAVSDFKPKQFKGKINSDKVYSLKLKPLPKIIQNIRTLAPKAKVVMFKLECGVSDTTLIQRAKVAQQKVSTDFIIANRINPYRAYIIDRQNNIVSARNKEELVKKLLRIVLDSKQNHPLSRG